MCQYDSRCRVGQHRPGTVCPYTAGVGPIGWPAARATWSPLSGSPTTSKAVATVMPRLPGQRYTRAAASGGISLADVLALLLATKLWDRFHDALGGWGVLLMVVLVLTPFALALCLCRHCTAWNSTVDGRCARVRPTPLGRCHENSHSHRAQFLTAHEVGAASCFLLGVLAVWFVFMG